MSIVNVTLRECTYSAVDWDIPGDAPWGIVAVKNVLTWRDCLRFFDGISLRRCMDHQSARYIPPVLDRRVDYDSASGANFDAEGDGAPKTEPSSSLSSSTVATNLIRTDI